MLELNIKPIGPATDQETFTQELLSWAFCGQCEVNREKYRVSAIVDNEEQVALPDVSLEILNPVTYRLVLLELSKVSMAAIHNKRYARKKRQVKIADTVTRSSVDIAFLYLLGESFCPPLVPSWLGILDELINGREDGLNAQRRINRDAINLPKRLRKMRAKENYYPDLLKTMTNSL